MKKLPIIGLVLFNILPLFGVLYFSWSVLTMMLIYWSESLIIGLFTVFRMVLAQKASPVSSRYLKAHPGYIQTPIKSLFIKVFLVPFFFIHFGVFMTVHLIFIFVFIAPSDANFIVTLLNFFDQDFSSLLPKGQSLLPIALTFAGLFVYHFITFIYSYLLPKAYAFTSTTAEMAVPYPRIIFTHLVIMIVATLTIVLSVTLSATLIASIIVVLKTLIDLSFYIRAQKEERGASFI